MSQQILRQFQNQNSSVNINLTYPYSDKYEYRTYLERIDLDAERIKDLRSGKGFIIESSRSIKTDVKSQMGIFSSRFGSTMSDIDSFNGKYRCKCGLTRGSLMHGETCPHCGTLVKFYDDDVSIFGWLVLKPAYFIIHPNIYRTMEGFIGPNRLASIIEPIVTVNSDGLVIHIGDMNPKKDEPFKGIGMFAFKERYDEILDFYLQKYPAKQLYYDELQKCKNITFTHSIPVFSALLRPSILENGNVLTYQECNEYYQIMVRLVHDINRDKLRHERKPKEKLNLLNDLQVQFNNLYFELKNINSKKKGDIRAAIAGRYSFSSRSVIRQDPYLHANEIKLPFHGLLELCQQLIINILVKSHNMTYADAYKRWYKCHVGDFDKTIYDIIDGLIKDNGGLDVLINRNPSINLGSLLYTKCIGINLNYTMSLSLLVLKPLQAD